MATRVNTSMDLSETAKRKSEVLEKANIGNPKAGHIRLVTSKLKGAGGDRYEVFEKTDVPLKINGKENQLVLHYLRKFEAKKRNQAMNNIVDIILPPGFKAPKMTDDFILTGRDTAKDPLTGVTMEQFMEAFVKAVGTEPDVSSTLVAIEKRIDDFMEASVKPDPEPDPEPDPAPIPKPVPKPVPVDIK